MGKVLPLAFLATGKEAVVRKITGGRTACYKLSEMGFTNGTIVRAVRNDGYGPMIVSVRESRIAIGRGMAQKIMVEEANSKAKLCGRKLALM